MKYYSSISCVLGVGDFFCVGVLFFGKKFCIFVDYYGVYENEDFDIVFVRVLRGL